MQIKILPLKGDVIRAQTVGKIGQNDSAPIDEPLKELLGPDIYSRKVLLGLAESDHCDSLGISWLLRCNRRFRDAGGRLVLHSVPPLILDILRVMHLEKVLCLADDEEAALARAQETHS